MNNIDDIRIKEKDYDTTIKYIEWCSELKNKNIELQDKIVMTISTALFGIIIVNLDKISLLYTHPWTKILFITLIISNSVTIIFLLISLKIANKSIENDIESVYNNTIKRKYYFIAKWTQYIYLFSFAFVTIIFCIILCIVSYKELTMDKKQENNVIHICNESYLGTSKPILFSDYLSKQNNQENNNKINSNNTDNSSTLNLNNIQSSTLEKEKD
ncbi:TPA: hypothetical protein SAK48_001815 [Campylobacter jejuni]|nr:hypothetical protein [Campylobacter jejuni]